jgi:hypothetical protein
VYAAVVSHLPGSPAIKLYLRALALAESAQEMRAALVLRENAGRDVVSVDTARPQTAHLKQIFFPARFLSDLRRKNDKMPPVRFASCAFSPFHFPLRRKEKMFI